ncbi:MAG: hypothetical protein H0T17_00500 [Propionibacteriales bacterium]|nr:hypothetical protein [Propionibacteriales bacterium]
MAARMRPLLALAALAATSVLTGCDQGTGDASADPPVSSQPTTSPDSPTTPGDTTADATPASASTQAQQSTPPPTTSASPPASTADARSRAAQIRAKNLPGFNSEWVWDRAKTVGGPGPHPPPVCSRSSLISIGGVVATRTDFGSSLSEQATAIQVTAVFPDQQTALTAQSVLIAWHDRCQRRLKQEGYQSPRVSNMSDISTDADAAKQWLVTYRPVPGDPESVWFHAEGFVRRGDAITFLVIRTAGQDYNYPRGGEPMDRALELAARRLL